MFFSKKKYFIGWGQFSRLEQERDFWNFVNDSSEDSLKSIWSKDAGQYL